MKAAVAFGIWNKRVDESRLIIPNPSSALVTKSYHRLTGVPPLALIRAERRRGVTMIESTQCV